MLYYVLLLLYSNTMIEGIRPYHARPARATIQAAQPLALENEPRWVVSRYGFWAQILQWGPPFTIPFLEPIATRFPVVLIFQRYLAQGWAAGNSESDCRRSPCMQSPLGVAMHSESVLIHCTPVSVPVPVVHLYSCTEFL